MKYYKVITHYAEVEEIEVDRESDSSIWINSRRVAKKSNYDCYFLTIKEAKQYLMDKYQLKISHLERDLKYYQNKLEKATALPESEKEGNGGIS